MSSVLAVLVVASQDRFHWRRKCLHWNREVQRLLAAPQEEKQVSPSKTYPLVCGSSDLSELKRAAIAIQMIQAELDRRAGVSPFAKCFAFFGLFPGLLMVVVDAFA